MAEITSGKEARIKKYEIEFRNGNRFRRNHHMMERGKRWWHDDTLPLIDIFSSVCKALALAIESSFHSVILTRTREETHLGHVQDCRYTFEGKCGCVN